MSKNLIIRISNGFGNQMFLYAAAYAFSRKLGYNLLVDDETGVRFDLKKWSKKKRLNWKPKYELEIFNLKSDIAKSDYKFLSSTKSLKRKFLKLLDKFFSKKNFLIEKLDKNKKTLYSDIYLTSKYSNTLYMEGYFESEKYFKEYRNELLNEFSFKFKPNLENNTFKQMIDNSNVVSIAFRSNRFSEFSEDITNKSKLKKTADFENKAVQYIYRGVEYFKSKVKDPKFLIWSNNFENLNKYFDPKTFIFVKNKDENKVFLDFFLMCQCKYFIVGSTSFHWWPAWLCNSKEKIVLCPKEQELNLSSNANFWPESWIKI